MARRIAVLVLRFWRDFADVPPEQTRQDLIERLALVLNRPPRRSSKHAFHKSTSPILINPRCSNPRMRRTVFQFLCSIAPQFARRIRCGVAPLNVENGRQALLALSR
jgi:hypothetical protein